MDIQSDIPSIAREMVNCEAGSVIITENRKAIGIITERDLVKNIVAEDRRPSEVNAEEIFSTPLITIEPEKSVVEASEIMLKANIKRLPVLEKDTICLLYTSKNAPKIPPISPAIIEYMQADARYWSTGMEIWDFRIFTFKAMNFSLFL